MLKVLDSQHIQGEYLLYKDLGKLNRNAKTHKYEVTNRLNKSLVGYVKWWTVWKQYCFFPLNCIMEKKCLREMADFCEAMTVKHRAERPVIMPKEYKRTRFLQKELKFPMEE